MRRLIVGMTGSTGAIFGVRFLEALKHADIESHLIVSKWAQRTIEHETNYTVEQVRALWVSMAHSWTKLTEAMERLKPHQGTRGADGESPR